MEVFLVSLNSVLIVYMTISTIIKALNIALKRKEISKQKYRLLVASSTMIGVSIATALPFVFIKVFERIT
uniref:hypothetical protein n=1 Tax=uncultured Allobacillus sp. TaxID=1638025 RepID=UPI002597864A|nr:hypothetical protein [uncultured Allobacillus sp.]